MVGAVACQPFRKVIKSEIYETDNTKAPLKRKIISCLLMLLAVVLIFTHTNFIVNKAGCRVTSAELLRN